MRTYPAWPTALILAILLLAACTRDRPTEAPVAAPTDSSAEAVDTGPAAEPDVVEVTPQAEDNVEDDVADDEEPTPEATEEAATFQYIVSEGDTLLSIALDYGADVETIRRLNNLFSDDIRVGQPLRVPYTGEVLLPGMPTPTPGPYYYTVQQGDTLGDISLKFNVDTLTIIEANNLLDADNLIVGSDLLIPGYEPEFSTATVGEGAVGPVGGIDQPATHIVQIGETLSQIAEAYDVDANSLAIVNNITNRNVLRVGQELVIPGLTLGDIYTLRGQTHIVQSGESLSEIAALYGKSVDEVIAFNNISDANEIYVGQELIIPE